MKQTICACVYRQPSMVTVRAIIQVLAGSADWRLAVETGDALISRARSAAASKWLREQTQEDVFVMTDDDFYFTLDGLNALTSLCREKRGIVAGVTPLRSGEHCAIVPLEPTDSEPWRDSRTFPREIKWAGGLIAYHRDVFTKLTHTLPFLHKGDRIEPFWPFFAPAVATHNGMDIYLSEDYACHERARQAGFHVYVQPACQVGHLAEVLVTAENMEKVREIYSERI